MDYKWIIIWKCYTYQSDYQSDARASRGIRAILCHPKKMYLDLVSISCVFIFGYPFGSNKGSNSHSSTISVLG